MWNWGEVQGDDEADAIIWQRKKQIFDDNLVAIFNFILIVALAVWYVITDSRIALASEIIAASWLTVSGVKAAQNKTYTMLLIAERRIQLVEQQIDNLNQRIP